MSKNKGKATTGPAAPKSVCGNCAGPLGAYMFTCPFCSTPVSEKQVRARLRRVLHALCGLFEHTHSPVPDALSVSVFAFGTGATTGIVLRGLGASPAIWFLAGLAVWAALHFPLKWWRERAEQRDRERIYQHGLEPLLQSFIADRGVDPSKLLEVARDAKALKNTSVMPMLERSFGKPS